MVRNFEDQRMSISEGHRVCLRLKFGVEEVNEESRFRRAQFEHQIQQLRLIEEVIVKSEQDKVRDLIILKQQSAQRFQQERTRKLRE